MGKTEKKVGQKPDFSLELGASPAWVVGVDEAGRGPWAGPVTAGAVWINPKTLASLPQGLNDSKKLKPANRQELFSALKSLGDDRLIYGTASLDAEAIDANGILPSTFAAMDAAVCTVIDQLIDQMMEQGNFKGDVHFDAVRLLVDGNLAPDFEQARQKANLLITPVVKGDQKSLSIAAASIIAKETRDQVMDELDRIYPEYGWASNKGYGTKTHQNGLAKQGPCRHHRFTYKPVLRLAEKLGSTR